MQIKAIVIDDEPLSREGLSEYISRIPFMSLAGSYENPMEGSKQIAEGNADLIFLDIQTPVITGLDFLATFIKPPLTVIITAYPEYAIKGYEFNVLDYLLKPVSFERFLKACNKARDYLQYTINTTPDVGDYIFVKCDQRYEKIFTGDILYVEARQNYVAVFTISGKYVTHMTMKAIEATLPPNLFIRIHKSYLISIKHIENIEGSFVRIKDMQLPISRDNKDEILQKLLQGKFRQGK